MLQRLSKLLTLLLGSMLLPLALAEVPLGYGSGLGGAQVAGPVSTTLAGDWRYSIRPNENIQEVAARLLTDQHDFRELLRHNGLSSPADARPGMTLRVPVAWLRKKPRPARVRMVSGEVVYKPSTASGFEPLEKGMRLNVGDEVRTYNGRTLVELADGSTLRLQANSTLVFDRLTQFGKTGMADTQLRLERGRLENHVKPIQDNGSRYEVETPSAVAAVRGTVFRIATGPNWTQLEVTEGRVAFGRDNPLKEIPAGFGARIEGSGPMDIAPLPPAPKLASLPAETDSLPLELKWSADNVGAYQVNIIDESNGRWILSRQVTREAHKLGRLQNGRYRLEVAAISESGLMGKRASRSFTVSLTAKPAEPLSPEAGATLKDKTPSFRWRYSGNNELGRVEVSDAQDFNHMEAVSDWVPDNAAILSRPLRPGSYYWRVVTEAGGTSVATSEPRPFTIRGALPPTQIININYVDNEVTLFWDDAPQASGYVLQLARDPEFSEILKQATIEDTSATLRLVPGQRYYVRLRGETDLPLDTPWGPGRELIVQQ